MSRLRDTAAHVAARWAQKRKDSEREARLVQLPDGDWVDPLGPLQPYQRAFLDRLLG